MNVTEAQELLCGTCWAKSRIPDLVACLYQSVGSVQGLTDEQIIEYAQAQKPCPDHTNHNDGASISGKAKWLDPYMK